MLDALRNRCDNRQKWEQPGLSWSLAGVPTGITGLFGWLDLPGVGVLGERIVRSQEYSASVAVLGSIPGHALSLHHRRGDTGVQTGEPLEVSENNTRPLDGTEDEPGAREEALGDVPGTERGAAICSAEGKASSWWDWTSGPVRLKRSN